MLLGLPLAYLTGAPLEQFLPGVLALVARFTRDLDDPKLDARIDRDGADADALHVEGTPTWFVNGRRVVGAQMPDVFETATRSAR